jgi:hypothetical protein
LLFGGTIPPPWSDRQSALFARVWAASGKIFVRKKAKPALLLVPAGLGPAIHAFGRPILFRLFYQVEIRSLPLDASGLASALRCSLRRSRGSNWPVGRSGGRRPDFVERASAVSRQYQGKE